MNDIPGCLMENGAFGAHFDVGVGQLKQPLLQTNHFDGFALVHTLGQLQMGQILCALGLT